MMSPVWGRWTVRTLRVAALTAGLACSAVEIHAQQGPVPVTNRAAATKRTFTKNTTFNLPIQMDEKTRADLREVQLYVKSGNNDWVRQETVAPQTPHFTYRVPQDGEYWFTLVTVNRAGRMSPSDINAEPPALRVVVDTRAPVVEAAVTNEFGEPVLRVNVVDANADLQSARAVVLTESGDRALTPIAGQPLLFKLNSNDMQAPIRITASDLSGNITSRDVLARDLMPGGVTQVRNDTLPPSLPSTPGVPVANTLPPTAFTPSVAQTTPPPLNTVNPGNINNTVYRPAMEIGDRPANRKIINTTHAQVDYRIDTVGPSGIGRVDVYLTPDRGQTWNKVAEDQDKRSPADIDLPGEGLFGIRLAITNGNGFGGRAPKSGDRASFFIEVDATSPTVTLHPYEMVASAGAIDIRWSANDLNMAPEPVSLFYRTRTDNSWQPIARNIKNDGSYRWVFPREIGPQIFLKLEVADLAGNTTKVETPTPILLDMTEPEATLLDVTGVTNRAPGTTPPIVPAAFPGRQ